MKLDIKRWCQIANEAVPLQMPHDNRLYARMVVSEDRGQSRFSGDLILHGVSTSSHLKISYPGHKHTRSRS
jgi:hypothetical protein